MKKRCKTISILLVILALILILVGIFINNNQKKENYDHYTCLINEEKIDNYYFEKENKNYNFKIIRRYYFNYKNNKIFDGKVEVSCNMENKKDFDSFSCLALSDLPYDEYITYEKDLRQVRVTNTTFTKNFIPDENNYINSYIKYLEKDGFSDCQKLTNN